MKAARDKHDCSIIALDKFIVATRDSGYRGTPSAIAELVDNSIQAGATRIAIEIIESRQNGKQAIEVSVVDDGSGMDPFTLQQALRFGGSTRFGDRIGLGRYGMGLPNASLSQARRVSVYTWMAPRRHSSRERPQVFMSYLDVDEIAAGDLVHVPRPMIVKSAPPQCTGSSGTLVSWTRCDRLDNRRISTMVRKLELDLRRRFRYFIWRGLKLSINGTELRAFDPLYVNPKSAFAGAQEFGAELRFDVPVDPEDPRTTGTVRVRFSELPVHAWHAFSNDEKRRVGITKGAGVSFVRAEREVDCGWFFFGTKHRENYDDWWRCEVKFDPILDEAFGVTHTKQQVHPAPHLIEALSPELEAMARALNARARKAHLAVKAGERFSDAERIATARDRLLKPLPARGNAGSKEKMRELERMHPGLGKSRDGQLLSYVIVEGDSDEESFFSYVYDGARLALVLNTEHPFYRDIYKPLREGDGIRDHELRTRLELLLLAAARSEIAVKSSRSENAQLVEWSDTLATFLND